MSNNMEQFLIFGIPFLHYKTKNWRKYRRFLQESFYEHKGYTDFWDDRGVELPKYCDNVLEVITPNLKKFCEVIDPHPVMITEMWYGRSNKGDYHHIHNHGGTGYSAILYVKYNPKVHESTVFYSAFTEPLKGDLIQWQPEVGEGDLVIFPSYLLHEARPNMSDEERLIVSFNIGSWHQVRSYSIGKKEGELMVSK